MSTAVKILLPNQTDSDSNSILNIPISQEEILSVVKSLKNNKASGPNKIFYECIFKKTYRL